MYGQQDSSLFSRRTSTLALIVCLHALVIYALATGLGAPLVKVIGPGTVAAFLPNPPTRPQPLPPSPLKLVHQWVVPDEPQVLIESSPDEHPGRDVWTGPLQPPVQPPTHPPVVNRILGGPGRGFPTTDEYYPPAARRLGEMGVTTVRVCVDVNGRLTAEPMLLQSSGSARLDEGAVRLARAGSGHYRATTENGRPMNSCYPFRIRFELKY